MASWSDWFERTAAFDPALDPASWLRDIPECGAVYLMADAADHAVQLLCVGNLRYSLRRRLGQPHATPGMHVDYRAVVRRVYWRRVDGEFEGDWAYLEASRLVFPRSYRGILGFQSAWWLHVDPHADLPRYEKLCNPSNCRGRVFGPMRNKHGAARLIELIEDLFDLCRYEHILAQAPHGKACAYKEMGKCPAPCDGSISMPAYRRMIERSIEAFDNPQAMIAEHHTRMEQAADSLHFETAAKIKGYTEQLAQLGHGAFAQVRPMENFVFVSMQPGPRADTARIFIINQGDIREICGLIAAPTSTFRALIDEAAQQAPPLLGEAGVERMAMVAHHLFTTRRSRGMLLHIEQLNERSLAAGWRRIQKPGPPHHDEESEGLRQELQEAQ